MCITLLLLFPLTACAEALVATVVAVTDGDTLTVADRRGVRYRVRLSAIDAPERRQPYGERARRHLAALAHGKSVRVHWEKRDRYGRLVGRVLAPACAGPDCPYTIDLALEQIRAGYAWHYKRYAGEQPLTERWRYALEEAQARRRREGLWEAEDPVPPWSYREGSA